MYPRLMKQIPEHVARLAVRDIYHDVADDDVCDPLAVAVRRCAGLPDLIKQVSVVDIPGVEAHAHRLNVHLPQGLKVEAHELDVALLPVWFDMATHKSVERKQLVPGPSAHAYRTHATPIVVVDVKEAGPRRALEECPGLGEALEGLHFEVDLGWCGGSWWWWW